MNGKKTTTFTHLDLLRVVFKHGRAILTVTATATLISILVAFLIPPVFEGTSHVLIKRKSLDKEELPLSQASGMSTNVRQLNQEGEMSTQIALLKSRDLMVQVVDGMGLTRAQLEYVPDYRRYVRQTYLFIKNTSRAVWDEFKYLVRLSTRPTPEEMALRQHEELIQDVMDGLAVQQIPDSDVLKVSFRCSDPKLAQAISRYECEQAIAWHLRVTRQPGDFPFFQQQAEAARAKLEQVEKDLAAVRSNYNLIGAEEQKKLLIQHLLDTDAKHNEALSRKAALTASIRQLRDTLAKEPPVKTISRDIAVDPNYDQLAAKSTELGIKRAETVAKFTEKSREVKDIDEALQGNQKLLDHQKPKQERATREAVNPIYETLRQTMLMKSSELAAVSAEAEATQHYLKDLKARLTELNQKVHQVMALEREQKSLESSYDLYLRNLEAARVGGERERARLANLAIVQLAGLPLSPMSPKKLLIVAMALVGGLILGVAWAFTREFYNNCYENADDLRQEFDLPVFGTLKQL